MKGKHIFATLALSLTMGLGVFAAVAHNKAIAPAKAEMTSWYVVGSWNGSNQWSHSTGYAMTESSTNVWVKENLTFAVGDKFKVCDEEDGHWQGAWSYNNGSSSDKSVFSASDSVEGGNIICQTAGTYDITFTRNDWHIQVETHGATKYTVEVYVDNAKQANQEVPENGLPTAPSLSTYGQGFSGWFDDAGCTPGHEVTKITGNTTVYGKRITLPTVSYGYNVSKVSSSWTHDLYFYAFESGDRKNHTWPGEAIVGDSFEVPNDATIILVDVNNGNKVYQTGNIEQSGIEDDVLRVLTEKTGDDYNAVWESTLDEPAAEETYYVVSTETNWKYKNAPAMSTTSEFKKDNTAVLFDYTAKANEEIQIRGTFGGADKWYGVGGEGGTNYTFTEAGDYDLYLNGSKELYVAKSSERRTAYITCHKYNGAEEAGSVALVEYVYTSSVYTPAPSVDGYVARGVYDDFPFTVPHVNAKPTSDLYLHAKFTKVGNYLVGNEEFAGANKAWNIDGGVLLTEPAAGNKFEAVISITGASEGHPAKVKAVDYHADESLDTHYLTWTKGANNENYTCPTSISFDADDNIVFAENGTFAIYVNNSNEAYFNMGYDAFNTLFLNKVSAVCDADGQTVVSTLQAVWTEMKAAYNSLVDADKAKYEAKNINSGNESGTDQEKVIAKYKYIVVTKYAGQFEDFIWGDTYSSNNISIINNANSNVMLLVIIISSITVFSAAGLFLVIRRRREH